jgi:hypothetical protein
VKIARDMNDIVKAIRRRHRRVELIADDGLTLIAVAGMRLTFPEAEKLALGQVTLEQLRGSPPRGNR